MARFPTVYQAEAFCDVIDHGSFRSAAEYRADSQLELTRIVKRFTVAVGQGPLIAVSRRNGEVQLTAAGIDALDSARRMVAAARKLSAPPRSVRLGTYPSIAATLVTHDATLLETDPAIELVRIGGAARDTAGQSLIDAVLSGELDLAAAPSGRSVDGIDELVEDDLYSWGLRVVTADTFWLAQEQEVGIEMLDGLRVVAAPERHASRTLLNQAFAEYARAPDLALESHSPELLKAVAQSAFGFAAVLPDDSFGPVDRSLGPVLVNKRGNHFGGAYSLYSRKVANENDPTPREMAIEVMRNEVLASLRLANGR